MIFIFKEVSDLATELPTIKLLEKDPGQSMLAQHIDFQGTILNDGMTFHFYFWNSPFI